MLEAKTFVDEKERIELPANFIAANKLSLKRSEKEIKERIEKGSDPFCFGEAVLIDYLTYENAIPYLTEEYKEKVNKKGEKWRQITNVKEAAQDFLDYMVFAWGKAENQRGLSASRSIIKLGAWLWLLGREDLSELINNEDLYNPYGAPALIAVCDNMGIKVSDSLREFAKGKIE